MTKYAALVQDVIIEECKGVVLPDGSNLEDLDNLAQDIYYEFLERDDLTTIFDIQKIFEERGWIY